MFFVFHNNWINYNQTTFNNSKDVCNVADWKRTGRVPDLGMIYVNLLEYERYTESHCVVVNLLLPYQ